MNPQFAQQQPQFGQGAPQAQFPFQFPFQPQMQPNGFQNMPQGAAPHTPHINPLFLAALQQQQQQQQQQSQQYQPQYQQPQQQQAFQSPAPPGQAPAMNFDQVKAQLDLLRNLGQGNQGPPPS
jgi:H/ACA ribonucleoprotein complex non-core subunit NAF1